MALVALLSDIHGNLEAMQAVLEHARRLGVERFYSMGDIVGYGPDPLKVCRLAREYFFVSILGNHDEAVLGEPDSFNPIAERAVRWTRRKMECPEGRPLLDYLANLPRIARRDGMIFSHGLMEDNMSYLNDTEDLFHLFSNFEAGDFICFAGHSHHPSLWYMKEETLYSRNLIFNQPMMLEPDIEKCWINVGSVGQPRDGDPRASYVSYDPSLRLLQFNRVPYEVDITARKISYEPELDGFLAERLRRGI